MPKKKKKMILHLHDCALGRFCGCEKGKAIYAGMSIRSMKKYLISLNARVCHKCNYIFKLKTGMKIK